MSTKNTSINNAPLAQGAVTVGPDLRLTAVAGQSAIEVHLTPEDAISIALLLFKFAYQIPGKHADDLRTLAAIDQPKDSPT